MQKVVIYTDGACRGNPGPGGYGAILEYTAPDGEVHRKELSGGESSTTNNRMEMMAAIAALEALKKPCMVELYSDSSYLVNAIEKDWVRKWQQNGWYRDRQHKDPAKNADLWQRLLKAQQPHQVTYHWVKGHADNEYNNRCDELAVACALKIQQQHSQ